MLHICHSLVCLTSSILLITPQRPWFLRILPLHSLLHCPHFFKLPRICMICVFFFTCFLASVFFGTFTHSARPYVSSHRFSLSRHLALTYIYNPHAHLIKYLIYHGTPRITSCVAVWRCSVRTTLTLLVISTQPPIFLLHFPNENRNAC